MIRFAKTNFEGTRTKFHFISIHESYTYALSKNTKYLAMDGQVCVHRWVSYDTIEPQGYTTGLLLPPRSINRIP